MGKNSREKNSSSNTRRKLVLPGFVLGILAASTGVYFAAKPAQNVQPAAPAKGLLIESRPVLSPAFFTGKAARAYKIAAEIPKVLDVQFCYCYCKKEKGHKTLLTCFTSKHGSKCDVCINEALYAHELYKRGYTLDEIVIAVDKKFYRPPPKSRSL